MVKIDIYTDRNVYADPNPKAKALCISHRRNIRGEDKQHDHDEADGLHFGPNVKGEPLGALAPSWLGRLVGPAENDLHG